MPVGLLLAICSAALLIAAPAWAQGERPPHLSAESALLLATDGTVLFAKNASEEHAPASLVKLMTLYLACEDLEAGRAQWDRVLRKDAKRSSPQSGLGR